MRFHVLQDCLHAKPYKMLHTIHHLPFHHYQNAFHIKYTIILLYSSNGKRLNSEPTVFSKYGIVIYILINLITKSMQIILEAFLPHLQLFYCVR